MNNQLFGIIRRMIKRWWLLWYLVYYRDPETSSLENWYKNEVARHTFRNQLIFFKRFREDWRDTVLQWWHGFRNTAIPQSKSGLGRARKQQREIDDLIDWGIRNNLILSRNSVQRPTSLEIFISTDDRARNFIKILPFVEACAKEYGYFASILTSLMIGIGGTLLTIFGDRILKFLFQ